MINNELNSLSRLLILLTLFIIPFTYNSQVLNQSANWPNLNWSVGGNFMLNGLLNDPTSSTNFTWDDDAAGVGTGDNIYVESPVIDLSPASTAGENYVNVTGDFVYRALNNDILTIDYWDADANNWVTLETFLGNTNISNDYRNCFTVNYSSTTLDISTFTASQLSGFKYRINYDDQGGFNWGFCFGSPTIVSSACAQPIGLQGVNVTSSSATLIWAQLGSALSWEVEWGISGFTQGTGTHVTSLASNSLALTGLSVSSTYDFYVRAICANDTTGWAGPGVFSTTCAEESTPYFEGFEVAASLACWSQTNTPGYAWFNINGPTTSGFTGPSGASIPLVASDIIYAYAEASQAMNGDTARLESPPISLVGLSNPQLTFEYHMYGADIEKLIVQVENHGTFINVDTISDQHHTNNNDPWLVRNVNLSAFAGNIIRLGFLAFRGNGFNGDIAIDDIAIDDPVGIEDYDKGNRLLVYPNPSNGLFTLNIENTGLDDSFVEVMNIQGKVVFSGKILRKKNNYQEQIDLRSQPKGIYVVKLTTNHGVFSERVLLK